MTSLIAPASTAHIQVIHGTNSRAGSKSNTSANVNPGASANAKSNADSVAESPSAQKPGELAVKSFGAVLEKQIAASLVRPEEMKAKELKTEDVTTHVDNVPLQEVNQPPDISALIPSMTQNGIPQTLQAVIPTAIPSAIPAVEVRPSHEIKIGQTVGKSLKPEFGVPDMQQNLKNQPAEIAGDGKLFRAAEMGKASQILDTGVKQNISETANPLLIARADGLSTLSVSQLSTQSSQSALIATVEPKVGTPDWDGALGQKISWMATQSQKTAELHLNPPNLGPLEVRLTITNDQTNAQFVSHHPAVRDAIESALPRLREMLAENGLTLGNVSVSSQSFSQQQTFTGADDQPKWQNNTQLVNVEDSLPLQNAVPTLLNAWNNGIVNTFA